MESVSGCEARDNDFNSSVSGADKTCYSTLITCPEALFDIITLILNHNIIIGIRVISKLEKAITNRLFFP